MTKAQPIANPHVFHITVDGRRTSFSLDNYLADLLAVHLNMEPKTKAAHQAITQFLTEKLFAWSAFDPQLPISKQARRMALATIARSSLVDRYDEWTMANEIAIL